MNVKVWANVNLWSEGVSPKEIQDVADVIAGEGNTFVLQMNEDNEDTVIVLPSTCVLQY